MSAEDSRASVASLTVWETRCCGFVLRTRNGQDVIGDVGVINQADSLGYVDGECPGCGQARQSLKLLYESSR